ncbi:MAG: GNAT family N-acetyltransferase [Phycisphaeraceae bacterium]|nr:GNAT family N-acetyltransferase [Phycisphaeraceae bacterium]
MTDPADTSSPYSLPPDLPVPTDDGAAAHLLHAALPDLPLPSTGGLGINLRALATEPAVLFFYPRTGIPGQPPSLGLSGEDWDSIPGARGCTPQSCGFRDLHAQFASLGVRVLGVSTNTTDHQREFIERNHIPFDLLSDADLRLTRALNLPTFEFPVESGGPTTLIRRMAWFAHAGRIRKVWYPVFPPDRNAEVVLEWTRRRLALTIRPISPSDAASIDADLRRHWLSTTIHSRDRAFAADYLPGFVALRAGRHAGHITLSFDEAARECEVVTLSTDQDGQGAGSALLDAAFDHARSAGARRVFLTTTNDNLRALAFYQLRGMSLVTVHRGMMARYRDRYLPGLPRIGQNGIPLRDEVELEYAFSCSPPPESRGDHPGTKP